MQLTTLVPWLALLVMLVATPVASAAPSFTADVNGNFILTTASNAAFMVNGVDILATIESLLALQSTVTALQKNITTLQATVNDLTLNNTLLKAQVATLQVGAFLGFIKCSLPTCTYSFT